MLFSIAMFHYQRVPPYVIVSPHSCAIRRFPATRVTISSLPVLHFQLQPPVLVQRPGPLWLPLHPLYVAIDDTTVIIFVPAQLYLFRL